MPNLLDEAVRIVNQEYLDGSRPEPSAPELKRATQLVQKILQGAASQTDQIVLSRLLQKMGTSTDDVFAAVQEMLYR